MKKAGVIVLIGVILGEIGGAAYFIPANPLSDIRTSLTTGIILGGVLASTIVIFKFIVSNRKEVVAAPQGEVETEAAPESPLPLVREALKGRGQMQVAPASTPQPTGRKRGAPKKKFCGECGAPATTKFCGNCGAAIDVQAQAQVQPQTPSAKVLKDAVISCEKCNYTNYQSTYLILPIFKGKVGYVQYLCPKCLTPAGDMEPTGVTLKPNPEVVARMKRIMKNTTQGAAKVT